MLSLWLGHNTVDLKGFLLHFWSLIYLIYSASCFNNMFAAQKRHTEMQVSLGGMVRTQSLSSNFQLDKERGSCTWACGRQRMIPPPSIYPSSIHHVPTHWPIHSFTQSLTSLPIHSSIHLSTYPSTHPCIHLFTYHLPSIHPSSIHPPPLLHSPILSTIHPSNHTFIHPSFTIHFSVYTFICNKAFSQCVIVSRHQKLLI